MTEASSPKPEDSPRARKQEDFLAWAQRRHAERQRGVEGPYKRFQPLVNNLPEYDDGSDGALLPKDDAAVCREIIHCPPAVARRASPPPSAPVTVKPDPRDFHVWAQRRHEARVKRSAEHEPRIKSAEPVVFDNDPSAVVQKSDREIGALILSPPRHR